MSEITQNTNDRDVICFKFKKFMSAQPVIKGIFHKSQRFSVKILAPKNVSLSDER